jgi:hypothetical protein
VGRPAPQSRTLRRPESCVLCASRSYRVGQRDRRQINTAVRASTGWLWIVSP